MALTRITVDPTGWLIAGDRRWRCALGENGVSSDKREGDKTTPSGTLRMVRVFYRPDRCAAVPITSLPIEPISADMGWCDDPEDPAYNQLIHLPHAAGHEKMWRDDHLYDVVVVLDHNTNPIQPGLGSAIFMHVAKPDYAVTEGCIALKIDDLLDLLRDCNASTDLEVPPR